MQLLVMVCNAVVDAAAVGRLVSYIYLHLNISPFRHVTEQILEAEPLSRLQRQQVKDTVYFVFLVTALI